MLMNNNYLSYLSENFNEAPLKLTQHDITGRAVQNLFFIYNLLIFFYYIEILTYSGNN